MVFTWSPRMLKVDSKEGELGLVRQLDWLEVVKMGDEVTILEGGEFLSVAPDTNSIKSAWSNTWLADSKRLWISTWALLIFKGVTYFFSAGCSTPGWHRQSAVFNAFVRKNEENNSTRWESQVIFFLGSLIATSRQQPTTNFYLCSTVACVPVLVNF